MLNIVMCDQPPENRIHLQKEIVYVQPGYGKFYIYKVEKSVQQMEIFCMYQFPYY